MNKIDELFYDFIDNSLETKIFGGFGHCAYCSAKLQQVFAKENIDSTLLSGRVLSRTKEGIFCKNNNSNLIESIKPDEPDLRFRRIKESYIKRGDRIGVKIGHVVVLINDTIYDPTSKQFGLPSKYDISYFKKVWEKTSACVVEIKEENENSFKVGKVKTIGMESDKPFTRWV